MNTTSDPRIEAREHINRAAAQLTVIAMEHPEYREGFVVLARAANQPLTKPQLAQLGKHVAIAQERVAAESQEAAAGLDAALGELRQAYQLV